MEEEEEEEEQEEEGEEEGEGDGAGDDEDQCKPKTHQRCCNTPSRSKFVLIGPTKEFCRSGKRPIRRQLGGVGESRKS